MPQEWIKALYYIPPSSLKKRYVWSSRPDAQRDYIPPSSLKKRYAIIAVCLPPQTDRMESVDKSSDNSSNRARNTQREILFALERLLHTQAYVAIGIREICIEARISKPTFYRYFEHKEDIGRWLTEEALRHGMAEVGRRYTWFEGIYRTLLVYYRHKVFYSDPQSTKLINSMILSSSDYLKEELIETITERSKAKPTEKLVFQIESFNFMHSYVARQWGEDGMQVPPEDLAKNLTSVVPRDLFKLLDEPSSQQN